MTDPRITKLVDDVSSQAKGIALAMADQNDTKLSDNEVLCMEAGIYAGAAVLMQTLGEHGMLSPQGMAAFLFAEGER